MKTIAKNSIMLLIFCSLKLNLFGAVGNAIIPHIHWGNRTARPYTEIDVSNITNQTVSVSITLYNYDGTLLLDKNDTLFTAKDVSNYNENPSNGSSVTFELGANQTGFLKINSTITTSSFPRGYGRIEWEQNSTNSVALVAYGKYMFNINSDPTYGAKGGISIPINNGLPF